MHADYEVRLPLEVNQRSSDTPIRSDISSEVYSGGERGIGQESENEVTKGKVAASEGGREMHQKLEQLRLKARELEQEQERGQEQQTKQEQGEQHGYEQEYEHEKVKTQIQGKRKWLSTPVLIFFLLLLLVGGYVLFNNTVRKGNLERRGWDMALSLNSVEGYLDYMATFPRGAHFDEAHEALRKLKSEEAMQWERLKETDNTAELRDFLNQHPDIPFAPLVEQRLDSLSWAGAASVNTPEAYSEYIHLSQQGQLRGDYVAEARQKREELLSALVESVITDSVPE